MGDQKKTEFGTGRAKRASENPPLSTASTAPPPSSPVGTPAPVTDSGSSKARSYSTAPDPLLDTVVAGRYKIIKKLGEGGMGSVYLALHNVLEKQVALKVLHGELGRKPELVERFMQEAKAASRIRHENVIDISDFGVTPEGVVFFAMELLQGHDLHDEVTRARLQGRLLPWSRTKKIFLQICAALSAAHARGIVHRDLKPENVYLVDFLGDPDFVKLLDFGIAKVTDVAGSEEGARKLTKTGMLFGTPEYMSPEQARGDKIDHRIDIYAMGCILFQLVAGRVPFQAENFMGVLSQHLTEEPPEIAPEVFDQIGAPRALANVIDMALAKDREVRYQTIDELAAAVRIVSGDPPPADKSQPMRAANVPMAGATTRQRPPSVKVNPATEKEPLPSASLSASASASMSAGRSRTQWTGNLSVPQEAVAPPAPPVKSKLPLFIGAAVLGAGAIALVAMVAMKRDKPAAAPVAAGSAGGNGAVTPPPPPPPKPESLPVMASIAIDSNPQGALVVDANDASITYGKTPTSFSLPGSQTPRQFKLVLKGYGETTIALVPNQATLEITQELVKGATKSDVVVTPTKPAGAGSAATKTDPGAGSAATKTDPMLKTDPIVKSDPGAGSATTKTEPGAGSGTTKPDPGAGSGAPKPDPVKPKSDDCADDSLPCLKSSPIKDPTK